jgi:hypothetical protein
MLLKVSRAGAYSMISKIIYSSARNFLRTSDDGRYTVAEKEFKESDFLCFVELPGFGYHRSVYINKQESIFYLQVTTSTCGSVDKCKDCQVRLAQLGIFCDFQFYKSPKSGSLYMQLDWIPVFKNEKSLAKEIAARFGYGTEMLRRSRGQR